MEHARTLRLVYMLLWVLLSGLTVSSQANQVTGDASDRELDRLQTLLHDDPQTTLTQATAMLLELSVQPDPQRELALHSIITDAQQALGRYELALDAARKWEAAAKGYQDRRQEAMAVNSQGISRWHLGQQEEALAAYRAALTLVEGANFPDVEGDILNNLGMLYHEMGDLDRSLEYLSQALEISDEDRNPEGLGHTLNSIGLVYRELNQLETAMEYLNRAYIIHRRTDNRRGMADALNNMGVIYQQQGRADLALQYYRQSVQLEEELNNRAGIAEGLNNMGEASAILQESDDALLYFRQAADLFAELGDLIGEADVRINLARQFRRDGRLDEALETGNQAIRLTEGITNHSLKLKIFAEMATIHAASGDFQEAYNMLASYMSLAGQVQVERADRRASDLEARLKVREMDREITLLQQQQSHQRSLIRMGLTALLLLIAVTLLLVLAYRGKARANRLIREANMELMQARDDLHRLARVDPLTGLYNRRAMTERLGQERIRFERTGRTFSLVLGDIDHFKSVNDEYGHACGDDVLTGVSRVYRESIRRQDAVARWGGEEFLILLPETSLEGARVVAEKIRITLEEMTFPAGDLDVSVTMTLGVTVFDGDSVGETLRRADAALYEGKRAGRNRVIVVEPLPDESRPASAKEKKLSTPKGVEGV